MSAGNSSGTGKQGYPRAVHFSELTAPEQRVLGCLIEKRWTTPDQYPLSLNALRLACNQSTSRDPVTDYDEATVREAAQRLSRYGLASAIASIAGTSTVPIDVMNAPSARLDDGSESTAYFVVAEAVTNAQKHARASRIWVYFDLRPGVLSVLIQDDGVGGAVEHAGLGLEGLRDRVEGIGGRIVIDSPIHRGTRISAEIPATLRASAD